MLRPARPKPIVCLDGKFEIVPAIEIYKVRTLRPRSDAESVKRAAEGDLVRIVFSDAMYDHAMHRADEFEKSGKRVEFVYAEKDVQEAIKNGDFHVVERTAEG